TLSPELRALTASPPGFSSVAPAPRTAARATLSLHDALPICAARDRGERAQAQGDRNPFEPAVAAGHAAAGVRLPVPHADLLLHRSEEHTSELQSRENLVCRLLLEKKKNAAGC